LPPLSSGPLSLSHYYPIDYKQSLCGVSICTSYTSVEKKSTTESERERERERGKETTNYTIPKKKRKKGKKRTRHTSASSTIVIISADCNDAFTNKTMTRTFFIYIMNNETTYRSENVQAMHAQLPIYVQQICARLEEKKEINWEEG
jgi:hypothetical protein